MALKFALTGTHSAGKTTLVNELSKNSFFRDFHFFTERSKYLKESLQIPLNEDSQIVSQYIFLGERARELYDPNNSISDRSVYDVLSYTLSANSISDEDKGCFMSACQPLIKFYDCIFYVDHSEVKIEENGLRHTDPNYREQINQTILDLLEAYPPPFLVVVKGTVEERVNIILSTLNEYL